MKIDIHSHYIPRDCYDLLKKDGRVLGPSIGRDASGRELLLVNNNSYGPIVAQLSDPEVRIRDMDKMGVEKQVLSAVGHGFFYDQAAEAALGCCRKTNDGIARAVSAYPDRFIGMGTLPMQDVKRSISELERIREDHDFKSIEIGSNINGKNLEHPDFWPLYEKAQALQTVIFVHPTRPVGMERMNNYYMPNVAGYPNETSMTIAGLIFGGVLEKFPELKLVFSHGGGGAPFVKERWQHAYNSTPECRVMPKPPNEYFKHLYFDCIVYGSDPLVYLVQTVGAERVLLGSDYPFTLMDPQPLQTVRQSKLSDEEKYKIIERNVAALLGVHD